MGVTRRYVVWGVVGLLLGAFIGVTNGAHAGEIGAAPNARSPEAYGLRLQDLQASPGLVLASAAQARADRVLPGVTGGASRVSKRLVLFSDDQYGEVAPGTAEITKYYVQSVPAWIVTYSGVTLPSRAAEVDRNVTPNTELNVVIDARTGEYLEMYSYQ